MRLSTIFYSISFVATLLFSGNITAQQIKTVQVPSASPGDWEVLEKLQNDGLSKDVLQMLDKIIEKSIQANNGPEFFKALQKYPEAVSMSLLEAEEKQAILVKFQQMSAKLEAPLSNLMHLFLAEQLSNYQYEWGLMWEDYAINFSINGKTIVFSNNDEKSQKEVIDFHRNKSMENKELVQRISLKEYANSIGITEIYYLERPWLFDLLAEHQLAYLTRDADGKSVSPDSLWFDPSETFLSASRNEILALYQELELFHWRKKEMDAYVFNTLLRLQYVKNLFEAGPGVKARYDYALSWLSQRLGNDPAVLNVILAQADVLASEGQSYHWKNNPSHKDKNAQAVELLQQGLQKYPASLYVGMVKQRLQMLMSSNLDLRFVQQTRLEHPDLLSISYRNVPEAYLTVYHIRSQPKKSGANHLKGYELTVVHEQKLDLDTQGKYNNHTKDFIIPAWKNPGSYLVLVTPSRDSTAILLSLDTLPQNATYAYYQRKVSSFIAMSKSSGNKLEILVHDAASGKPVEGAQVYTSAERNTKGSLVGKTNKSGVFSMPLTASVNWNVYWKNDSISEYVYYSSASDSRRNYTLLTDRGIYRPGQPVYFKVYAFSGKSPQLSITPGRKINVELTDDNNVEVASLQGVANDFGTFSGTLQLPAGGFLLGNLHLSVNGESVQEILVEEYKRPTFEVKADFDKTAYGPGDEVKIKGNVKAYAGYGLSDAQVEVKISAVSGFMYRGYGSREELVLDTVIRTDATGAFTISFKADISSKDWYGKQFSYDIVATSTSGESQSTQDAIFIGKSRPEWEVIFPSKVLSNQDKYGYVALTSENDSPGKEVIRASLWKKVQDKQVVENTFAESEFKGFDLKTFNKMFPNSLYGDPDQFQGQYLKMDSMEINSGDSLLIRQLVKNTAGDYELRLSYGTGNEIIEHKIRFRYIRTDLKKQPFMDKLDLTTFTAKARPGQEISFLVSAAYPKMDVLVEIYRGGELLQQSRETIKKSKLMKYTIPATAEGGIDIFVTAVRNGQFFRLSDRVEIPYESKQLDVKLETRRDIMRPGAGDKWILSVTTADGSPVSAEMLAAMTDASLNMFAGNVWNMNLYFPAYAYNPWHIVTDRYRYEYADYGGKWGYNVRNQSLGAVSMNYSRTRGTFGLAADMKSVDGMATYEWEEDQSVPAPVEEVRKNFNETAFFYPHVRQGSNGKFELEFTLPDALTRWKFQALAHDKTLRTGYVSKEITAQKELMAEPNEPRFFRAGDTFVFSANVVNVTETPQDVTATLEWFNPLNNEVLPEVFGKMQPQQIRLESKGSGVVSWTLNIPAEGTELVAYRIRVASDKFADSEEKMIPVLSNRTQIIQSVPVTVTGKGDYVFELPELTRQQSSTVRREKLVLEYTSSPIWSVVMSLPYMTEYPYDCAEQLFSKYFANRAARQIVTENYQVLKPVLDAWKISDPEQFISALEKNADLKTIVLTETPWVLDAKSETEQKQKIALLFDDNQMRSDERQLLDKLILMQLADGGWSWFPGGKSNVYITQHILAGFGQLAKMSMQPAEEANQEKVSKSIQLALEFLNTHYKDQFSRLTADERNKQSGISSLEVQWLYLSALLESKPTPARDYYASCLQKHWVKLPLQVQAMAGVFFHLNNTQSVADKILKSMQNRATSRPNLGTYWNENKSGYAWDRNAIETQSALIGFYTFMKADPAMINTMKLWLLNQKRGQYWESTKATASACMALLLNTNKLSATTAPAVIRVGGQPVSGQKQSVAPGYVRESWHGKEITPAMGKVNISQVSDEPGFGSLSLVSTELIDKVTQHASGLGLQKQIFVVREGAEVPVTASTVLALGELVRIRLQLTADRDFEFVHLKDLRAAGMESVEVHSGYKSSGVLYFYSTNRDASTEFFLDYLPKGKHSLTYELRVSGKGTQSMGYALAECLYAPEFRANTKPETVTVR